MAIDTPTKRRAAAFVSRRFARIGVTPDAFKGVLWRRSVAWGYLGQTLTLPHATISMLAKPRVTLAPTPTIECAPKPRVTLLR